MSELLREIRKKLETGMNLVLVSVTKAKGSVPRGPGAHMLVGLEGRFFGTIGGGAVEYKAEKLAVQMLSQNSPSPSSLLKQFSLTQNAAADIGMICGGELAVSFVRLTANSEETREALDRGLKRIKEGLPCWLVLKPCRQEAFQIMGEKPEQDCYAQALVNFGRVYIFGGGHVAQQLVPVLSRLEFQCVVLDDRAEFTEPGLFSGAAAVLAVDFSRLSDFITVKAEDYAVIMTRGHQWDMLIQEQILNTPACYIGVMGSSKKKEYVRSRLCEKGYTAQQLDRVKTPIGLPILAKTPEELAISIAAELIEKRAQEGNGR